ncbi:YaeQ family protein [Zoogloea sp.]|uniref:YaeQ family protein n=1 Tax=Zoogloea sp. TaxID=49181 RepID=UPI002639A29C|nr:YaeQ family protein [Zoogloea sp.]MDD3352960.1 YaeQ family protein [Zoogloea sp.]
MALKSTIFRATLAVSDLDRGYFGEHVLTIARHPSETDERMMIRVLAFALHAAEYLEFGKGISSEDEPALWQKDDTGRILRWIEVGLPDERLLRRAAGRADEVFVLAYGGRVVDIWWQKDAATLARLGNLRIMSISQEDSRALAALAERNMSLSCTIQDGQIWFSAGETTLSLTLQTVYPPA